MELKEIAVVSGKPGLYKIIKPAVNGVILEALDGTSARFIAGSTTKVSVLGEISVYTENGENIPLEDVFRTVFAKHGKEVKVGSKSSDSELRSFFTDLIPEHDKQRVYTSDIRKIAVWYNVLVNAGFEEKFATKAVVAEEVAPLEEAPKKEKKVAKKEATEEAVEAAPKKAPKAKKDDTEKKATTKKADK